MKINTFWNILIKIIGIWLVLEGIYLIPEYVGVIIMSISSTIGSEFLFPFLSLLLVLIFYYLILKVFVFRTQWLIKKLHLEENFEEDHIEIKSDRHTILTLSVTIIGAIMLVNSLPELASRIILFFQSNLILRQNPETSGLIFYIIKSFISYLLMTNGKKISDYIIKLNNQNDNEKTINDNSQF